VKAWWRWHNPVFHRDKVIAALEAKRDRFADHNRRAGVELDRLRGALDEVGKLSCAELEARLARTPLSGAKPTAEQDRYDSPVVPFSESWADHAQARAWAKRVLLEAPTFAVDGSQISPAKDFSVPVGAVQVGWYENPHAPGRAYVKDLSFEVLAPDELGDEAEGATGFPDWRVNWRRFELECQTLIDYMTAQAGESPAPICFFDGSLIVSFAQRMRPEQRDPYVRKVIEMLNASQRNRVPLVGYIDASHAKDLITMVSILLGEPTPRVSDGALLQPRMNWGDRSLAYVCARDDAGRSPDGPQYYDRVCFVYLKTTGDGPPARLDLPRWLAEDQTELARVLDVVRAECVVGNGYPYAIETADAVAVITMQDRQRFYATFQQFAEREKLGLRLSRKATSKLRRRT